MNGAIFIGEPIHFVKDIKIYPAKVKDILANPKYGQYVALLTMSQEDIWDMIAEKEAKEGYIPKECPTPFQLLLSRCQSTPLMQGLVEEAFYFFIHENVRVLPDSGLVLVTDGLEDVKEVESLRYIDEEQFFSFQNKIREAIGDDPKEPPIADENPRVALIKAKGRRRERLVKKKGNASSIPLESMLSAVCCMQLGLSPLNIGEVSYPAIQALFPMARRREKYKSDVQFVTGGAVDTKKFKLKDWIVE